MLKAATSAVAAGRSLSQPNIEIVAVEAERGAASGHLDPFLPRHRPVDRARCTRPAVASRRTASRCHMYSSVSWCIASCSRIANAASRAVEERIARPLEVRVLQRIEHLPVGFRGELLKRLASRPSASRAFRIVQPCVPPIRADRCRARTAFRGGRRCSAWPSPRFTRVLKLKAGQMALVENNRVAQIDRTPVVGVFADQIEQRLRPRTVAPIPVDQGLASRLSTASGS